MEGRGSITFNFEGRFVDFLKFCLTNFALTNKQIIKSPGREREREINI